MTSQCHSLMFAWRPNTMVETRSSLTIMTKWVIKVCFHGVHVFKTRNNVQTFLYRQTSNIRRAWVGNKIADHSDVFGASPVGAAPTTSSFSTKHLTSMDWSKTTARRDEHHLSFGIWCVLYTKIYDKSMGIFFWSLVKWFPDDFHSWVVPLWKSFDNPSFMTI